MTFGRPQDHKKPKRTIEQVMAEADALDRRRQKQIANQVESINRILHGDADAATEITTVNELLAAEQMKVDIMKDVLKDPMNEHDPIPAWAAKMLRTALDG